MPRTRKITLKRRRIDLSGEQRVNLTCGRSCGGVGPEFVFENEEERRAAWEAHRAELLAAHRPGKRPAAYWDYDCPFERLPHETDYQLLYRLVLLEPHEVEYFTWRNQYPPAPATGVDPRELLYREAASGG
jgi:hypothetical protein